MRLPRSSSLALAALAVVAMHQAPVAMAATDLSFCKCRCFSNYTIIPLYRPKDPSKPCLTCTKQFCLDQQLPICQDASKGEANQDTGTGDEGDVQAKCFQRDSLLAKASVLSFLLVTFALLASAAFKERIHAALAGQDGRLARLWEARLLVLYGLG